MTDEPRLLRRDEAWAFVEDAPAHRRALLHAYLGALTVEATRVGSDPTTIDLLTALRALNGLLDAEPGLRNQLERWTPRAWMDETTEA
jgi:hypothetical protein